MFYLSLQILCYGLFLLKASAAQCNADNCLRAIRATTRNPQTASSFCEAYISSTPGTVIVTLPASVTLTVTSGITTTTIGTSCATAMSAGANAPVKKRQQTSLPSWLQSQCTNLGTTTEAARISSACSCFLTSPTATIVEPVTTSLASVATTVVTSPSSTETTYTCLPSCVPSALQNTDFATGANGLPTQWTEMEYETPISGYGVPVNIVINGEYYSIFGTNLLNPNYDYLTIQQYLPSICNGDYQLSFQAQLLINLPAISSTTDCNITAGITGYPESVVVYPLTAATPFTVYWDNFTVSGLPDTGGSGTLYFITYCETSTNYPEIVLISPYLAFEY